MLPICAAFAGAEFEEANMIRNHKLPVRFFELPKQSRRKASSSGFFRPPIFLGIKSAYSGFIGDRVQINTGTGSASEKAEGPSRDAK
jgi:hypothetical protein